MHFDVLGGSLAVPPWPGAGTEHLPTYVSLFLYVWGRLYSPCGHWTRFEFLKLIYSR
jgi:hypothetical protein